MSSENNEEEEKYITLVNKILDDNGSLSKNETIAILNSIASIIEHEERVYLESITDPFEDTRRSMYMCFNIYIIRFSNWEDNRLHKNR